MLIELAAFKSIQCILFISIGTSFNVVDMFALGKYGYFKENGIPPPSCLLSSSYGFPLLSLLSLLLSTGRELFFFPNRVTFNLERNENVGTDDGTNIHMMVVAMPTPNA
jgi:hypothetical protein